MNGLLLVFGAANAEHIRYDRPEEALLVLSGECEGPKASGRSPAPGESTKNDLKLFYLKRDPEKPPASCSDARPRGASHPACAASLLAV